ncbi:MAG TPA: alpha/beta hydrolase [Bacteroidales bacterium]|nr:alpha/beta hydrolase [Bacteroidales bacterium]HPS18196.1 alpha/beta hydrolase [Bacteroidales bacterium]
MKSILLFTILSFFTITNGFSQEEPIILKTLKGEIKGTLTLPKNKNNIPVVLIIAGSGPTDRNGNSPLLGVNTNSYKLIAEKLQKNGIASVRFDKRGIGESKDTTFKEKNMRFENYIDDVKAWIEFLSKDNRFNKIIIAGHSEGSLIGMVASVDNPKVNAYISISGAARSIDEILKEQLALQPQSLKDLAFPMMDTLKKGDTLTNVPKYLYSLFRPSIQPYMISWMKYNPQEEIKKITVPVLILQGSTDIQVSESEANLLSTANPAAKKIIIKNMNHVLKDCDFIDKQKQMTTIYSNPKLPLNKIFVKEMISFIKELKYTES